METGVEGAIGDKLVLLAQDRRTSVRQLQIDMRATTACSHEMGGRLAVRRRPGGQASWSGALSQPAALGALHSILRSTPRVL